MPRMASYSGSRNEDPYETPRNALANPVPGVFAGSGLKIVRLAVPTSTLRCQAVFR